MYQSTREEVSKSFLDNTTLTSIQCLICSQEPTFRLIQKHKVDSAEKVYICKTCLTNHLHTFTSEQYALRELTVTPKVPTAQVRIEE